MRTLISAAALSAIGAALSAVSYGAAAADEKTSAPTEIVRAVQHGHAYQNGGIGRDEVVAMDHSLQRYSLRMTFSEGRENAFATGIDLKVFDSAGQRVFGLHDAGPITDVALPAGSYRVEARFGGVERSGTVVVKAGEPASLALHWPKDET
jgi:hypothetical protein